MNKVWKANKGGD